MSIVNKIPQKSGSVAETDRGRPRLLRGVACRGVKHSPSSGAEPQGFMGKAGTFPRGPITIYRFLEFAGVGGYHDVELAAFHRPFGKDRFVGYETEVDFIDDPTPNTGYAIWFWDKRANGEWREYIFLDGKPMGVIAYVVGGVGE